MTCRSQLAAHSTLPPLHTERGQSLYVCVTGVWLCVVVCARACVCVCLASWQGLYTLVVVGLLLTNALAILHEKRFLPKGVQSAKRAVHHVSHACMMVGMAWEAEVRA